MAPPKFSDHMADVREFISQIDPGECQDRTWRAVLDIAEEEKLAFLIGDAKLVTEANYTTGKVTITGGVNVALTGGVWVSPGWTNRKIVIQGRGERYGITITGAASGTLDSAFLGTATAGLTYTMFRDTYSLPADCEFAKEMIVYDVAQRRPLDLFDYETFTDTRQVWNSVRGGIPVNVGPAGLDSSGVPQVVFDPPPGSARVYLITYYRTPQRPADLSGSLNPLWPNGSRQVIALRAAVEWSDRKGHPRRQEYRNRLSTAMRKFRSKYDGGDEMRKRLGPSSTRGVITLFGGTYSKT